MHCTREERGTGQAVGEARGPLCGGDFGAQMQMRGQVLGHKEQKMSAPGRRKRMAKAGSQGQGRSPREEARGPRDKCLRHREKQATGEVRGLDFGQVLQNHRKPLISGMT